MDKAISLAKQAIEYDEVPIGAVIVKNGEIIAEAFNQKESKNCAIKHAEMVAIELASEKLGNWYLDGCDLYVTFEPCAMCTGALINARVDNIYFGAYDYKYGCCGSLYNLACDTRFNHNINVIGGIKQEECANLLSEFFSKKRMQKKEKTNQ